MKSTGRYYRHYKGDYYEALSFNGVDDKGLGAVVYIPLYESEHSFFTQRLVRFAGATVYNGNVVERFTEVSYDDLPKFARHFVTVRHIVNAPVANSVEKPA